MNEVYRVGVTGSRTWPSSDAVWRELSAVVAAHPGPVTLVVGDATDGADSMARAWARTSIALGWDVELDEHRAKWRRPDGRVDRSAGYARNARMVASGLDELLSFGMVCQKFRCTKGKPHVTHGTGHCTRIAEQAGVPVKRVEPAALLEVSGG